MEVTIRNIGNSKGVVLPKPLLAQAGLSDAESADISIENNAIVLRKPKHLRDGWAQAAQSVAMQGEDALLMGEFGNATDEDLVW